MSSPRGEMLEKQLAESNETIRRYAVLVGSIKEWAEMDVVFGRPVEIPDKARLDEIRRLLKGHGAERALEANGL